MDMGMKLELLVPGMQHTEEADLGAEVSRIASDFEKCFCTGPEQQSVEDLAVQERQWCQLMRQCEDHMDVTCREKFSLTRGDPPFAGRRLTLRAVALRQKSVSECLVQTRRKTDRTRSAKVQLGLGLAPKEIGLKSPLQWHCLRRFHAKNPPQARPFFDPDRCKLKCKPSFWQTISLTCTTVG